MRLYISIIAATALTSTACGKKAPPAPEKAAEVAKPEEKKPEEKKPEEKKPEEMAKPEEKKPEEKKPEEMAKPEEKPAEVRKGAADRTAAVQAAFDAVTAGKTADAFANFADDATWTDVGAQGGGETKGRQAIIDAHTKMMSAFTDTHMKASRIIEAGEYQVVEFVWTGKNTAALADGTAATNKDVALAGGMVLHYNADGLVDKAWNFQDQVSMMEQLGLIPGLPADYVAAKLPETTEVVKGDFNPALKDQYMAFGAKMKPDTIDAAIDEMMADDYSMVDGMTGKTVTGKAAMKEAMHAWMKMFTVDAMNVDMAMGAGDYLVVVGNADMTYLGGIGDIKPDGQKVKSHSLEISKFENGKFKSYASYENHMEVMAALAPMGGAAEKPAEAAAPAGEAPSFGVASCDTYVKNMMACGEKVPEAGRDAFKQAMTATVDGFKKVAAMGEQGKAALEQACGQALAASKQGMGALCPDVKWE
ncbi:MAG: nuclear transport factor 2 family protein [Myxococcota bacterium]